jgi:hypothetical protein
MIRTLLCSGSRIALCLFARREHRESAADALRIPRSPRQYTEVPFETGH